MTHYRAMFDSDYLGAWDLKGDTVVTIERVEAGVLQQGTKKDRKPIVFFRGSRTGKGMALNKTNAKTIAKLYGNDTAEWVDQPITIYPTKTQFGAETVDCIRIRPERPQPKRNAAPQREPEPMPAESSDGSES